MKQGYFITVEGIEGVGKSTAIDFMRNYLEEHNISFCVSREPGGTPFAEQIRDLLLNHIDTEEIAEDTELLLMFASRSQHIAEVIRPALAKGEWVLCDRFTDASFAYQGGGRGIPSARIEALEEWVQGDLRPDLVILLDAPVELAMTRARDRSELDRIESEDVSFFSRVRQAYLDRAEKNKKTYKIIDATKELNVVQEDLKKVLDQFMTQHNV